MKIEDFCRSIKCWDVSYIFRDERGIYRCGYPEKNQESRECELLNNTEWFKKYGEEYIRSRHLEFTLFLWKKELGLK